MQQKNATFFSFNSTRFRYRDLIFFFFFCCVCTNVRTVIERLIVLFFTDSIFFLVLNRIPFLPPAHCLTRSDATCRDTHL